MNVTANNYILPLRGEEYIVDPIREQGLRIRINWEPAVTYNSLQQFWWHSHFANMTHRELRDRCKQLGIRTTKSRAPMIDALAQHFQQMIASN